MEFELEPIGDGRFKAVNVRLPPSPLDHDPEMRPRALFFAVTAHRPPSFAPLALTFCSARFPPLHRYRCLALAVPSFRGAASKLLRQATRGLPDGRPRRCTPRGGRFTTRDAVRGDGGRWRHGRSPGDAPPGWDTCRRWCTRGCRPWACPGTPNADGARDGSRMMSPMGPGDRLARARCLSRCPSSRGASLASRTASAWWCLICRGPPPGKR